MLNDNEYTEFENRKYLNPQIALDEANSFVDKLRNTQQANNQQIWNQAYNLGSALPSNQGGLGNGLGTGSYFTSRYQTPQTNSAIADLRSTAQANALNTVLQNEQSKWQKRYNDAYRAQQKSAYNKSNSYGSTGLSGLTSGGVNQTDSGNEMKSSWEMGDTPVTYDQDIGTSAGWGEFSDWWTGEYNFTLPGGTQLNLGGWDEELKLGSDGIYYVWNKKNNTYTPVLGNEGSTSGGTRWWQR